MKLFFDIVSRTPTVKKLWGQNPPPLRFFKHFSPETLEFITKKALPWILTNGDPLRDNFERVKKLVYFFSMNNLEFGEHYVHEEFFREFFKHVRYLFCDLIEQAPTDQ